MSGKIKRAKTETKIQQLPTSVDGNVGSSDGADGLWLERFDHPLMNDVILETLFMYMKSKDLKACRLVCKKWTIQSLPSARATFEATINGDYSNANLAPTNHGIKDFLQLFASNCLGIPFTRFKLGSFDPTIRLGKELIQLCGKTTKKIDLNRTAEIQFFENISELLKSVPKLEYFKMPRTVYSKRALCQEKNPVNLFADSEVPSLKYLTVLEVEKELPEIREKNCPTFFEELLSEAENISTILTSDSVLPTTCGAGFELLKIFEKLGRESKLEILSLPHVNSKHLELLQRVAKKNGLKLKQLRVKSGLFVSDDLWFQLLEMLKENLASLQIHPNFTLPNNYPRMPQLKLLDLKSYGTFMHRPNFNDFGYSFPALQCLRLSAEQRKEGNELHEFYLGSLNPCPITESLILQNFVLNIRTFERTLNVFPNLKELEISIAVDGPEILRQIWTEMTRLEKLKMYCRLKPGSDFESLVTGISADGIKKIKGRKLTTLKDRTMEVRRERILGLINEHRVLPSIRNLTNLKYLSLDMTANGGKSKPYLRDLTGFLGLYSMKNLRHLSILNSKLSKRCSEILVTDMGLLSWKFQSPGELEIIPSRWDSDDDFDWDKFPSSKFSFK